MSVLVVSGKLFPAFAGDRICSQGFYYALREQSDIKFVCRDTEEGFSNSILSQSGLRGKIIFAGAQRLKVLDSLLALIAGSIKQEISLKFVLSIRKVILTSRPDIIVIDHLRVSAAVRMALMLSGRVCSIHYVAHNGEVGNFVEGLNYMTPKQAVVSRILNWNLSGLEWSILRNAEKVYTLTSADSKELALRYGVKADKFESIRLEYPFKELFSEKDRRFTKTLVMVGSMDWYPNIQGALDFIETTWPKLRDEIPGLRLFVVGKNPPAEVLIKGCGDVTVTGMVDDVDEYLNMADALIVPNRLGSGIKVKVYEAWSKGLPVFGYHESFEGYVAHRGFSCESRDELISAVAEFYSRESRLMRLPRLYPKGSKSLKECLT